MANSLGTAASPRRVDGLLPSSAPHGSNTELLTIDTLVRRGALSYGRRTAILDEDWELTYGELDTETDAFSVALLALGVVKGDRIALLLPNQWQYFVAYFAVVRIGALVVPVNHRLVPAEIDDQLARARCRVLVHGHEFATVVDALRGASARHRIVVGGGARVETTRFEDLLDAHRGQRPQHEWEVAAEDPSGIWFTSGTTGVPKGAVTTHASALWAAAGLALAVGLSDRHRLLATAPLFHRGPTEGLHLAGFLLGTPHVMMRRFDAGAMLRAIEEHRITHAFVVPTMGSLVLDHPERADRDLTSMQGWFSASAPLPPDHRGRLETETTLPPGRLFDAYGITESLMIAMLHPEDARTRPTSVGRPVPGVLLRIIDGGLQEMPCGSVGEIAVAAPSVAAGYLDMPDAWGAVTYEQDGRTWYRSGDLGYVDPDGFLYLVDRVKDMVVSGGENVYSAEVERVLGKVPGIAEVAVVGTPHERWGECVTAAVVRSPGAELDADAVLAFCEDRLAPYKRPRSIVFVESLPRSSFGKVQKHALKNQLTRRDDVADTDQLHP